MKPNTNRPSEQDYTIQALRRGLSVLDALLEARAPLTLEQICARTQLPKSTAFRVVANLLQDHYLIETGAGYWLGLKVLRLGAAVEERLDLKEQAAPFLGELRDRVNHPEGGGPEGSGEGGQGTPPVATGT